MKKQLLILAVIITSCSTQKRATPCRQCPHYSYTDAEILEYIKLNPFPALSLNVYHDLVEVATSLGLNIIVLIGFLIDFNDYRKQ